MADRGPDSETPAKAPLSEPKYLYGDGMGDAGRSVKYFGPEQKRNETIGDDLSESSDDSDSEQSDSEQSDSDTRAQPVAQRVTRIDRSSAVVAPQTKVTVLNFGEVKIEGKTDGVEIGNKTEYHGSVTVQQIVHGDAEGWSPTAGPSSVLRSRGLSPSGEASPPLVRRTGMVLRSDEATVGRGGVGDGCVKTGNSLLVKHLLGRKVETSAWIPIALISCFALIAIAIDSFIFGYFHHRRDTETPASHGLIYKPTQYADIQQIGPKRKPEVLPNLHRTVIIPRIMWQAKPALEHTPLKHPVEYVIVSHTATEPCSDQAECSMVVQMVQKFHVESRQWSDIGYNFLVGGDGNAYEGRGWEYVGAHAKGYNVVSIGISFIGTFSDVLPPSAQIRACKLLIKEGVSLGKIAKNYKLIAHRQVSPTESPGEKLYEELQHWEHWSPEV